MLVWQFESVRAPDIGESVILHHSFHGSSLYANVCYQYKDRYTDPCNRAERSRHRTAHGKTVIHFQWKSLFLNVSFSIALHYRVFFTYKFYNLNQLWGYKRHRILFYISDIYLQCH